MQAFDRQVLVVTVGRHRVGKTSLAKRFIQGKFEEGVFSTVGAMHFEKLVKIDDLQVQVEIWDTAGQEKYEALTEQYYRTANAAIVAYDITDKDSFGRAKHWVEKFHAELPNNFVIALVGNKTDLEDQRQIPEVEGASYAASQRLMFFETSARTGENVDALFTALVRAVPLPKELESVISLSTFDAQQQQQKKCEC